MARDPTFGARKSRCPLGDEGAAASRFTHGARGLKSLLALIYSGKVAPGSSKAQESRPDSDHF